MRLISFFTEPVVGSELEGHSGAIRVPAEFGRGSRTELPPVTDVVGVAKSSEVVPLVAGLRYFCVWFAERMGWLFFVDEGVVTSYLSTVPISTTVQRVGSRTVIYQLLKRVLDLVLSLILLPILLPAILVIAISVRLSSPGPIFVSYRRIRGHGRFFSMWKFRTMCVNSTEVLENYLAANPSARAEWRKTRKLEQDPRVTRVGQFLRRTSLDELPQIWNVLNGTMSLVGPRPIVAAEVAKYEPYFADYCMVKPGVTGLWLISGHSKLSYPDRVKLDTIYARQASLILDLTILFRTILILFSCSFG